MLPVFVLFYCAKILLADSESDEQNTDNSSQNEELAKILPSEKILEEVSVRLLDALIKRGQMEMAKGAFKTQLEVLRKVQPEQYKKFKKIPIEKLAAEAVMEQAQVAKLMPKTGNRLVDMLHENGIPIGSSIKGIQQAIKTQREMEDSDPAEQILKAVFEKFQKQILPGIVANAIAGRNPFQIPSRQEVQEMVDQKKQRETGSPSGRKSEPEEPFFAPRRNVKRKPVEKVPEQDHADMSTLEEVEVQNDFGAQSDAEFLREDVAKPEETQLPSPLLDRIRNSPRLSAIYDQVKQLDLEESSDSNPVESRLADLPMPSQTTREKQHSLSVKEALVLGAYEASDEFDKDDEDKEAPRKSPLRDTDFETRLKNSERLSKLLDSSQLAYQLSSPEKYLEPKKIFNNPNPQPGYVIPRQLPKRPRSMLPLIIGVQPEEISGAFEKAAIPKDPFARKQRAPVKYIGASETSESRVLERLKNNPALVALFENQDLASRLRRNNVLTEEQKGYIGTKGRIITTYPNRMAGVKTYSTERLSVEPEVKQDIEERPIPPSLFTPKGRHTRIRFVGATEREIPGLGGRLVLPSLDPTMPAINTAMHTQGKQRDEYDTTFKVPNSLNDGGSFGIHSKTRSEKFYGGDGMADAPALGPIRLH